MLYFIDERMKTMDTSGLALRVVSSYLKSAETQLEMGKKVEEEHDDVYEYFEKFLKKHDLEMPISRDELYSMIAKSHLKEDKEYYDKLETIDPHHKEAMDFTSISSLITPDKKLTDSEIARALRLSIAAELDASHLYDLIADAVEDKQVQDVLRDISNEEKVHQGELSELLSRFDKEFDKSMKEGRKEVTGK
jgi:hypothetical protein